jgi:hypothetical protein
MLMALYMIIGRTRYGTQSAEVRAETQRLMDYFAAWTPPAGITMLSLHVSADVRTAYALVQADSHAAIALFAAQYAPSHELEITPVITPDESTAAMIAGGLISAP